MSEPRHPLKQWKIWSAMVAVFALLGLLLAYLEYGKDLDTRDALDGVGIFGSIGIGAATCVTAGLRVVSELKCGDCRKGRAIVLVLVLPVPCSLLTLFALLLAQAIFPAFP